jgi:beta-lactamase regulating signal transducer with metallopeptidase domain
VSVVEFGVLAKGAMATLGMLAVQGTVLAILAYALTRIGTLRPAWQAAIWLVVAVKFALPWGPAMPWSLSDLVAQLTSSPEAATQFVLTDNMTRASAPVVNAWPAVGWIALASVWSIGALVVVARALVAQRRISVAARSAPLAPAAMQQLLHSLGGRRARLAVASDVGPHVVGMLRPIIVVPPALLDDPVLLRAVVLHELAHVRRLDAIARVFQIAASALLWWFPVVRLVNKKLELAREAACDAWALEAGDVARPAYARLLVRMASLRTHAHAHALAAPRSLDARVAAVLGPPVRARMSHLQRFVLGAFALLALGGARTATATEKTVVCTYTSEMAATLYDRFPDADLDGDGLLSRDEACDLQAVLKQAPEERLSRFTAEDEAELQTLLAEPLGCELDPTLNPVTATCRQ